MQLSAKSPDTVFFKGIAVGLYRRISHLHYVVKLQYAFGFFAWDKLQFALSSYKTLYRKRLCENLRGSDETTTSVLQGKVAMNERQELDEAPV